MWSRQYLILVTTALATTLTLLLLLAFQYSPEPRCNGLTLRECLSPPNGEPTYETALILGTNNLKLFVDRIAYDPGKDKVVWLYQYIPRPLRRLAWLYHFVTRKHALAEDAYILLQVLGPRASPAIPQLTEIASTPNPVPVTAGRALVVLDSIGEPGLAAICSLINNTNYVARLMAFQFVARRADSSSVRDMLNRALDDPDPTIRKQAQRTLALRPNAH
jgi:hypothetical protein